MPRKVEFQGAVHEFPDNATDEQISAALKGIAAPKQEEPGALSRFGKGVYDTTIGPVVSAVTHPIDTVKGAVSQAIGIPELQQIVEHVKQGNYGTAAVLAGKHLVEGPGGRMAHGMVDPVVEDVRSGNYADAAGRVVGTAASMAGPKLLGKTKIPISPKIVNPNAAEAAATAYLEGEGVPVSAAAKTGNAYVKNIQKAADSTPIGGVVAHRAQAATTKALGDTAERLASRVHPTAVAPEQAGEGVKVALNTKVSDLGNEANSAYSEFRRIEELPQNTRTVQVGSKQAPAKPSWTQGKPGPQAVNVKPINQTMQLPVDLTSIKKGLAPIYKDMETWMEPAARNSSQGFQAIKSLMEGPDNIPASQAEIGLGGLKQLARDGSGRNAGIAKLMTSRLQAAIDQTVAGAGPDAINALKSGRAATADQFGVKGIVDQLRAEPVQTFGQMTYAKDSGIDLLRQVGREAPSELPKIGRAFLDDLFGKAKDTGGFGHADQLFAKWSNLGTETKKLLYPNAILRADLDKFFLGAKKLAENPNPSGSGLISISGGTGALIVTHPATGIPLAIGAGALSKMMHSTTGVRLLTKGMSLPANKIASIATASQILKMAGDDVQPMLKVAGGQQGSSESSPTLAAQR